MKKPRSKRHLGTYYYAGTLLSNMTCGHKHTTVRSALKCKPKMGHQARVFMAHLGLLPGKMLG